MAAEQPAANRQERLVITVELEGARHEAVAGYEAVTAALKTQGIRFGAFLRAVPEHPEEEVVCAMNTLWAGGDLGG